MKEKTKLHIAMGVIVLLVLRNIQLMNLDDSFKAEGGLAKGYHQMPDGTIMKDSDHYESYTNQCGDYANQCGGVGSV
jgi:hypothetical protein|tara:strand:- start:4349 stop:4579 length:231 start_codon:yes stop_codon:yes gene_type:complete